MDIGPIRPAVAGVTAPVPKAPAADQQAAPTDLPTRAVVTAADDTSALQTDPRESRPPAGSGPLAFDVNVRGGYQLDSETNDLVYRWVDVESGELVDQWPEEAVLRSRALLEAWTTGAAKGRAAVDIVT